MDTVYARTEHGGYKVETANSGFKVHWPLGMQTYPNARQTIIALVNKNPTPPKNSYDPHLTFDRYFRIGKHRRRTVPNVDTLQLFTPSVIIVRSKNVGVDLERRSHEVRKLFYAGFGRRVARMGYEPDDVLQEVYKGLLVRNRGKCPFDSSKSSFGHYVHMVCGCVVSNYRRRYSRLDRNEVYGVPGLEGEDEDVATSNLFSIQPPQEDGAVFRSAADFLKREVFREADRVGLCPRITVDCIGYLGEGHLQKEMAVLTGTSPSTISRIVKLIRRVALDFRQ